MGIIIHTSYPPPISIRISAFYKGSPFAYLGVGGGIAFLDIAVFAFYYILYPSMRLFGLYIYVYINSDLYLYPIPYINSDHCICPTYMGNLLVCIFSNINISFLAIVRGENKTLYHKYTSKLSCRF